MISFELFGDPVKNRDQLIWQLKSSWIGKELLRIPVSLHIGVGIKIPQKFGKRKRLEAVNHLIKPIDNFNIFKALEKYCQLLENVIVFNKQQFYKTSIEKFYSKEPKVNVYLVPQIHESHSYSTEGSL